MLICKAHSASQPSRSPTPSTPTSPPNIVAAARRGPFRANVAVQRAMLIAIWNMATTDTAYIDPGGDYFTRLNPEKARTKAIRQLEAMGYHVTLDQAS